MNGNRSEVLVGWEAAGLNAAAEREGLSEAGWARLLIREIATAVLDPVVLNRWAATALARAGQRFNAGDVLDAREDARLAVALFDAAVGAEVVANVRASAGGSDGKNL